MTRAAARLESDRALIDLIRHRLSLPPEKRLNCTAPEDRLAGDLSLSGDRIKMRTGKEAAC